MKGYYVFSNKRENTNNNLMIHETKCNNVSKSN